MVVAPKPLDEHLRIEKLEAYEILDTMPEQVFDDITFLAALICGTPIALISLVDRERQWFKSRVGLDVDQTHRDVAFCAHAILEPDEIFEVDDAEADSRFLDNALVRDGTVRFYAGAPLQVGGKGSAIGTLCVIDRKSRDLDADQRAALKALARQVMGQLELRRSLRDLETNQATLGRYQEQLEQSNQQLAAQGHTDGMTGIANRDAFDLRLDEEFLRASRYGHSLSVLMIDIDHFKEYNDEFGHAAGDETLKAVASAIQEAARSTDFTARHGGEEFAVILPETGLEGAAIIAERLRRAVEGATWERRPVTVSIGVADLQAADDSADELLARADVALYVAKETGRNRVTEAVVPP